MVQGVAKSDLGNIGTINRVSTTNTGRVIYEVTDSEGKAKTRMSVAPQDCDKFESSFNKMLIAAPKLQAYMQNTSPDTIEKKQKMSKWIIGGGAFLGGIVPALKVKGTFKQISLTLLGVLAGLAAGIFTASKIVTPPGAKEFSEATQAISKLDIKPV